MFVRRSLRFFWRGRGGKYTIFVRLLATKCDALRKTKVKVNLYEICTFEIVCQSLMCVLRRVHSSNESLIRNFIWFKVYLYV